MKTNILDKNGNEISSGDIVSLDGNMISAPQLVSCGALYTKKTSG